MIRQWYESLLLDTWKTALKANSIASRSASRGIAASATQKCLAAVSSRFKLLN